MNMDITDTNANDPSTQSNQTASRPVLYARFDRSFGLEFVMLIFLSPPLIVLWGFVAYYYYLRRVISFPILKVAVYYSAGFALVRLLYGNSRATRRGTGVVLDGERIIKKSGGGIEMLEYADIRGVGCTKNPLFNKKMIIKSATGKTKLSLNLQGSYKMVEVIFEKLAAIGRFKENEKEMEGARRRLYTTAIQYNALYKMRVRHLPNFVAAVAAVAFLNGAVAMLYWERELSMALSWGFAGMLFQTLGYFAAERFWAWKTFCGADTANQGAGADRGLSGLRDTNELYGSFKTVHATAAVAALLLGMIAGIAVTLPA